METLRIIIDEREQTPWVWDANDVTMEMRSLIAGDYALALDCEEVKGKKMLSTRFAIERKSLDDFLGTVSSGWERFQRELGRMEVFPARVVIVEGNFAECCFNYQHQTLQVPQHNHPELTPSFIARRIAELTMMNVSILFAGDAQLAAGLAFRIFKRRYETYDNTKRV